MSFLAVWLLTHLIQTNPVIKELFEDSAVMTEMLECDLCTGFWVGLAVGPRLNLVSGVVADSFLSAAVVTTINHLFVKGMKERLCDT